MLRFFSRALIVCFLLSSAFSNPGGAQEIANLSNPVTFVRLNQGEEIQLPEDFVARLDGNQLKVALKEFDVSDVNLNRELLVSLIQEDGSRSQLRPDENGELTFENVQQGLAAIVVASGQATYSALAFYAVPGALGSPNLAFEVPEATVDPTQILAAVEASGTTPPGDAARPLSEFRNQATNRFRVYLQPNGVLRGRVVIPEQGFERAAGSLKLSFFRNGTLLASTVSAADGTFFVDGLQPGVHSVFASGAGGHAAFAFEVVAPKKISLPVATLGANRSPANQPVMEPADELVVLIIPPRLMPGVRDAVRDAYSTTSVPLANLQSPGAMSGAGGFGSGASGGGGGAAGGGLGGGGLGGLLGIAGLAVGITALSDNSDGFNGGVATPIAP